MESKKTVAERRKELAETEATLRVMQNDAALAATSQRWRLEQRRVELIMSLPRSALEAAQEASE